jgi:hypothetical protein
MRLAGSKNKMKLLGIIPIMYPHVKIVFIFYASLSNGQKATSDEEDVDTDVELCSIHGQILAHSRNIGI